MSNPTARQPIKSVVPSIEVELDGTVVALRYTFGALHGVGANPFDGSLQKHATDIAVDPPKGIEFLRAGMSAEDQERWTAERIAAHYSPFLALAALRSITEQIGEEAERLNFKEENGDRPPVA